LRLALCAVVAIALTASAFAHRLAPTDQAGQLALVLATGASLDDLCGGTAERDRGCPACLIAGAADLPPRGALPCDLGRDGLAVVPILPAEAPRPRPLDPGHGPQGPPVA
jgi:hypothetical protein